MVSQGCHGKWSQIALGDMGQLPVTLVDGAITFESSRLEIFHSMGSDGSPTGSHTPGTLQLQKRANIVTYGI